MYFKTIILLSSFFIISGSDVRSQNAFDLSELSNARSGISQIDTHFVITEVPMYRSPDDGNSVQLENGYARHQFINVGDWPPVQGKTVLPKKVEVIFTKYPKDSAFWLTDYQWLLAKRMSALFELDSNLNSRDIEYSIVLQTDCDNEFEAMQLFHGIRIKYQIEAEPESQLILNPTAETNSTSTSLKKLNQLMYRKRYSMDSTVFKVLDRNTEWTNGLLVLDWTGSMHGYGAEAMIWHTLNEEKSSISECAFFNDGNKTKDRKKMLGETGGIYMSSSSPVSTALKTMRRAEHKGTGGGSPENDMEAIVYAIEQAPQTNDVILIADNGSCIRDYVLIECVDRPIHIILCRTKNGVNPQYLNLAWKTGGSVHTKTLDINNIASLLAENKLVIDGIRYVVGVNGVIVPVNREEMFFGHCDQYYRLPKRAQNSKRRPLPDCLMK